MKAALDLVVVGIVGAPPRLDGVDGKDAIVTGYPLTLGSSSTAQVRVDSSCARERTGDISSATCPRLTRQGSRSDYPVRGMSV